MRRIPFVALLDNRGNVADGSRYGRSTDWWIICLVAQDRQGILARTDGITWAGSIRRTVRRHRRRHVRQGNH